MGLCVFQLVEARDGGDAGAQQCYEAILRFVKVRFVKRHVVDGTFCKKKVL